MVKDPVEKNSNIALIVHSLHVHHVDYRFRVANLIHPARCPLRFIMNLARLSELNSPERRQNTHVKEAEKHACCDLLQGLAEFQTLQLHGV
jgi:hypothetical protein